jgi:hypothetical protein
MAVRTHQVLGRTVTMPVEVRRASAIAAMFSAPASATQRMIDYSGLSVLEHLPRRAVVGLVFVRYVDGDLGRYHELAVVVLVRKHDDPTGSTRLSRLRAVATGSVDLLVHRLPVDGEFTMAAGRAIWGLPKELADFDVDLTGPHKRVALRQGDRLAVSLSVHNGLPVPSPAGAVRLRAYSHLGGVTGFTDCAVNPWWVRSRPGGARVQLGDHPIGRELAGLGLPKGALFSTTVANLTMSLGDVQPTP